MIAYVVVARCYLDDPICGVYSRLDSAVRRANKVFRNPKPSDVGLIEMTVFKCHGATEPEVVWSRESREEKKKLKRATR